VLPGVIETVVVALAVFVGVGRNARCDVASDGFIRRNDAVTLASSVGRGVFVKVGVGFGLSRESERGSAGWESTVALAAGTAEMPPPLIRLG